MTNLESLIRDLPDAESSQRFLDQFGEKNPAQKNKLLKNEGLLSDILTLVSYSPLLATTVLQNPNYLTWLNRHRAESKIRDKEELLESLGRFALTNSTVESQIMLSRFRRRELLRIFLHDIRRLATVSEITEEISSLADAILEYALQIAKQELDNRFGIPLETDDKQRAKPSSFCVVSLGKLGSRELNYSSDIDLLFIYSADGKTSGHGTKGEVTNREYFVKLAEFVTKLVGQQTGEGAAYRVDLRLRPHGRVGALALSVKDTIRYYQTEARKWERQVLIRSRASAGDASLYKEFFAAVENFVFSKNETVAEALENVRLSKEKINLEKVSGKGFNVKLAKGGIREIEFIAQALQLAYGGHDEWLRSAHTLITLRRLADRRLLSEGELTELFDAYEFLRRLEHLLQMENGLQTHLVPEDWERRIIFARRMNSQDLKSFDENLKMHTRHVSKIFERIFTAQNVNNLTTQIEERKTTDFTGDSIEKVACETEVSNFKFENEDRKSSIQQIISSLEKSDLQIELDEERTNLLEKISEISPPFAELIAANPVLIKSLPSRHVDYEPRDYTKTLKQAVENESDFARRLAVLRHVWAELLLEIVVFDVLEKITRQEVKISQTKLAEASLATAIFITKSELENRYSIELEEFNFAVLGLGKLGGGGMDYGSDLDLILIYDDDKSLPVKGLSHAEFYGKAVEIFVTTLSAMTREGSLYRVDLRLRPDGKNGATSLGKTAFFDYLKTRAAVWEWLAYVKIRAVGGDRNLGEAVESETRRIVHENAQNVEVNELRSETLRVRDRLETEKSKSKRFREIDIKFGAGGMLDVYFAMRFLQLRDNIKDEGEIRSTVSMLEKLFKNDSLRGEDYENFSAGYAFLSELDHNLRLTVGRSTRLPIANQIALRIICQRMKIASIDELLEKLTFHRLNIRASFENILQ